MQRSPGLVRAYRMIAPLMDPRHIWRGLTGYPRYLAELSRYRRLQQSMGHASFELHPCLHERTSTTGFDPHYTYLSYWATSQLEQLDEEQAHVDVGSHLSWVMAVAARRKVVFIDIRPFDSHVPSVEVRAGSILALPFEDQSIRSLSCLHVAEHIGLGRYGDQLDPAGTRRAVAELARTLASGGNLLFALPVGRERICFNAHRVHRPSTIVRYFAEAGLALRQFSAVDDQRIYHANADLMDYEDADYACGMFVFTRP